MKSEIIAVGSEMLTPYRQDTNSLYLTEKLNEIGVTVAFKTIVGDRRKDLVNAIRTALARTDIVILMGGLGPTEDDLTREAVAEALSLKLRRDAPQVAALHARAATWRIAMPENNLKQADVIEGATSSPIPTAAHPASGSTPHSGYRKLVMLVPGPPHECKPLFDDECLPRLREIVPDRHIAQRTLKAAMIPESQADKLLAPIYTTYTDVETTILAHAGDIQLTLLCSKNNTETRRAARRRTRRPNSKKRSTTGSTPLKASRSSRSFSTISACARPRSPSRKAAPAASSPSASLPFPAVRDRSWAARRLLERIENRLRRRACRSDRAARRRIVRGGQSARRRHPQTHRRNPRPRRHRHRRPHRRNRNQARRPGLHRRQRRPGTDSIERNFRGDRHRIREWASQQALDLVRRRLM